MRAQKDWLPTKGKDSLNKLPDLDIDDLARLNLKFHTTSFLVPSPFEDGPSTFPKFSLEDNEVEVTTVQTSTIHPSPPASTTVAENNVTPISERKRKYRTLAGIDKNPP